MKTIALFIGVFLLVFCQQKIEKTATINAPKQKNKKALILPASLNELYLCDTFKKYVKLIYNLDCVISKPTAIEESLRSSTNPYYFSANKILRFLTKVKPDTVDYIVLVTSKDIVSPHKLKQANGAELTVPDYGIFGYGQCPGKATTISTYRLQLKPVSKQLLSERFVKVCLHELGHNFGLPHCKSSKNCLMQDAAGTIKSVDNETYKMCKHCASKVKS